MADPKVCVSLEGTTVKEVTDEAARANLAGADMVEVRFDRLYLKKPQPIVTETEEGERHTSMPPESEWPVRDYDSINIEESINSLKESIPLPVIFTVSPVREGGFFAGTEEQRIEILRQAISSGVSWVDLELSIDEATRASLVDEAKGASCKVVASSHDVNSTPSAAEIAEFIRSNTEMGDVVKFCSTINDHQDALQIVEAAGDLKGEGLSHSLMGLGNGGDWARLHAPELDQSLVYATMRNEFRLSDKGLVNVRDLRDAWTLLEY